MAVQATFVGLHLAWSFQYYNFQRAGPIITGRYVARLLAAQSSPGSYHSHGQLCATFSLGASHLVWLRDREVGGRYAHSPHYTFEGRICSPQRLGPQRSGYGDVTPDTS